MKWTALQSPLKNCTSFPELWNLKSHLFQYGDFQVLRGGGVGKLCINKLPNPLQAWGGNGNESPGIFSKDFYNMKPRVGHDYLKSALSHQSFLAASHSSFCIVLTGSVLFFTWHLLPWRFVSRTSPLLFSSALALAVPDAVTSVASGPIRLPGKWWSCCLEMLRW